MKKLTGLQWAGIILGTALVIRIKTAKGVTIGPAAPHDPRRYAPGSPEQVRLFEDAAGAAGVPTAWASDAAFQKILRKESDGWVGIPNYTYGSLKNDKSKWPLVWQQLQAGIIVTKSSATGLGQMTLSNTDAHYPAGRMGIGDAHNEAVGMLRYIKKRYGTPQAALEFHQEKGWY